MLQLVERFEFLNKKLEEDGEDPMPTLKAITVAEWFQSYKRVWTYGVDMELVERNPWERMHHSIRGRASIKRRAFNNDDLKIILKNLETKIGAKRWLPILALYRGARLSELASMPRKDFKGDNFDLNNKPRNLKTDSAARLIPLHPRAAAFRVRRND